MKHLETAIEMGGVPKIRGLLVGGFNYKDYRILGRILGFPCCWTSPKFVVVYEDETAKHLVPGMLNDKPRICPKLLKGQGCST